MRAHFLFVIVSASLSLAGVGCSASSVEESSSASNRSESDQTEAKPASEAVAVVWVQAEQKVAMRIDASGNMLGSERTFQIAKGNDLLTMKTEYSDEELGCDFPLSDGTTMHYDGRYMPFGISLVGGEQTQTVVTPVPKPDPQDTAGIRQSAEIIGSVGPYIFVREAHDGMGCGAAHPGRTVTSFIWNVETNSKTIIQTPGAAVLGQTAEAELSVRGFPEGAVRFAEMIPSFDENGVLSFKYRFEKEACYACSDGQGNDYSVSAIVDGPVPEELESFKEPPEAVKAYLAANHTGLNGWSTLK